MPITSPGNDDDTGENHQPTLRKNTAEPVEQTLKQNNGIEEETVTRLPSKAFDEFLKALDRPVPQTARDLIGMEPDWL